MRSVETPGQASNLQVFETPTISLRQLPCATMINLRGPGDDPAFAEICGRIIGLPLPTAPNRFVSSKRRHCLWQGPDEWLIIETDSKAASLASRLDDELTAFHHAVTDVSGNRITLRLSGHWMIELLSAGCPLDFCADAFKQGMTVQTTLARTPVTVMFVNDAPTFDLLVRRSLVNYLQAWLVTAAGSTGLGHDR